MLDLKFRVAPKWLYQPASSSMLGEQLMRGFDDERRALWFAPSCVRYPGTGIIAGEVLEWSSENYVSPQEISNALSQRFPKLRWAEKQDHPSGQGSAFSKAFFVPWANNGEVSGYLYWNYAQKAGSEANTLLYFCQAPASGPATASKRGFLGSSQSLTKSDFCQAFKCSGVKRIDGDGPGFAYFFDTYTFLGGKITAGIGKDGTILQMNLELKNPSDEMAKRFFELALGYQITDHRLTQCRQDDVKMQASFGITARLACFRSSYAIFDSSYDYGG
ncbi:hypothetical protein [Deinococcus marmoris]|uniref:hypothetical protein n=1 Tax=Deinococcus marmoris TaxID=249408 RepID=UPI0011152DB8|nr:hypothetical protein [Deinococcus marmoris]